MATAFEIEFRWKELVIYWEGNRGVLFNSGHGVVDGGVTVVPDSSTWDRVMPAWLVGRRDEVIANLRVHPNHIVAEERDDSSIPKMLETLTR